MRHVGGRIRVMIESGTHVPGVSAEQFGLPPNTALRLEQPTADLSSFFTDYHVFDSEPEQWPHVVNRSLPAWPMIRIILADAPIKLRIGDTSYDPMPVASLYGTTSRMMEMTTHGGVTIGAGLTPLGWARLFPRKHADAYRDRVVPLAELIPADRVEALVARLRASDRGPAVKAILDDFLHAQLGPPHRAEPLIRELLGLILDPEIDDLTGAAERIGIDSTRLRRLSTRYFGFPPKSLLIRTRFLQSLIRLIEEGERGYADIAEAYFDASHFIRDSRRFLGVTPRQFLALSDQIAYFRAIVRARRLVFGAALQALDRQAIDGGASFGADQFSSSTSQ